MSLPDTVAGFTVIPTIYSAHATHILYGRAHAGAKKLGESSKALPEGRTLFLVNVPPDATERELSLFFKPAGLVEKVVFDPKAAEEEVFEEDSGSEHEEETMQIDEHADTSELPPRRRRQGKGKKEADGSPAVVPLPAAELRTLRQTGRTAHVVFLDASSLTRALTSPLKPRKWPRSEEPSGLAHYKALYKSLRPPLDAVREHADSAIARYDFEVEAKKQKSRFKKGEAVVDEDGFTLVTRGGAYGQTLGGGVGVASKRFQESGETTKVRKKLKKKEKEAMYAFQKHEKKRRGTCLAFAIERKLSLTCFIELIDLKRKWEEDKAKVEKLKESRRFKPY